MSNDGDKNDDGSMIRRAAASMAHEVRNAVAGITGTLEVLDSGTAWASLPPEVIEQFRLQIYRIQDSVDELLAWSSPTELRRTREEIHELIESALRRGRSPGSAERHVVVRDYMPGPIEVEADSARLVQVLRNVIRNACQAMPKGGRLVVSTRADEGRVIIRLSDSGGGMTPQVQAQAFEPFFTTKATGTGLGLPVVRRIVEAHGGEVAIDSSSGTGTTVQIALPIAPLTASFKESTSSSCSAEHHG